MNAIHPIIIITLSGSIVGLGQLGAAIDSESSKSPRAIPIVAASPPASEAGASSGIDGPDVMYTDCVTIANWGQVGTIWGYSLGSYTCNIGNVNLLWGSSNNGTPCLAMNAYRLNGGRLMQIGLSNAKKATVAAAGSGCGLPCNFQGGSVLGAGCRDVYGSSYNGGQSRLQRRSLINPWTGTQPGQSSGSGNAIYRRLQIEQADLDSAQNPGALYFIEGVYVASDEPVDNKYNNASYKQVTVSPGSYNLNVTGSMYQNDAAIYAWRDHGNGINNPDNDVQILEVDVPDEGRFIVGGKASDNGDGTWHYEYAIYNLNSHRSAGSFSVPIPSGVTATNIGFHDVPYHSDEIYDNTDWNSSVSAGAGEVRWDSPESFEENANTNALRWGTMYNFWFDADAPPADALMSIGLFRPGTPDAIDVQLPGPVAPCPGDLDEDDDIDFDDFTALLAAWGDPGCGGALPCAADLDDDGDVDFDDFTTLLAGFGPCP